MRAQKNKKPERRLFPVFFKGFCYFAALFLLFFMGNWLRAEIDVHQVGSFKHIQIIADGQHVTANSIEKVITANLPSNFFSLNFSSLRDQLLAIPWVEDISIRRVWPDRLIIEVYEQKPWAEWGMDAILNGSNQVVKVPSATIPQGLPQLIGPVGAEMDVINMYQSLRDELKTIDLKVSKLQLDPRHSWLLVLGNGVEVMLGKENVLSRVMRFVHVYSKLAATSKNQQQLIYVDLRYPNGFAVKWGVIKNTNFNRAT